MSALLAGAPAGVTWGWTLLAVLAAGATLLKAYSVLRKVETDAGGSMRADLLSRIDKLEKRIDAMAAESQKAAKTHAQEIKVLTAQHEAAIQIMRHRLANETASLNSLLMWLDTAPDKLADVLPKIRADREKRARNVAMEAGQLAQMKIDDAAD